MIYNQDLFTELDQKGPQKDPHAALGIYKHYKSHLDTKVIVCKFSILIITCDYKSRTNQL